MVTVIRVAMANVIGKLSAMVAVHDLDVQSHK